jgi:hypothetical protein
LIAVFFCGIFSLLLAIAAKKITPSYVYGIRAQFAALPANDAALEAWLSARPGVVRVHVIRKKNEIDIIWIMSQDLMRSPPVPDVRAEFEKLGYMNLIAYEKH